jgi:hypothetical protein
MITDVAGRVKNVQLPPSRPLLPLLEAINNSIDAIEDVHERDGRIEVEVIRDENTLFSEAAASSDREHIDIVGFIVRDNGVGFDERNYEEFNKSDTTYKASRGGKGIGRFMWLAAFEKVEIESVFCVDGKPRRRQFTFCLQGTGIENHSCEEVSGGQRGTTVRLVGYKERYRKQCPKRLKILAAYIIEEFLDVFLGPSCPKMVLIDRTTDQKIDLDTFYESEMVAHSERKQLEIKHKSFDVLHVRLYSTHIPQHMLCLCACHRVVTREKLTGVPNLVPRLQDKDGKEFVYAAYVNSSVLDAAVNADRTGFNLAEGTSELLIDEITSTDVRKGIQEHCKDYLSPYTEPVKEKKQKRIRQFIERDGAMYRPILKHLEPRFESIEPDATDDEIDRELYEASHELQVTLKKEGQELFQVALSQDTDFAKFREQFNEYFEKISEVNRANLARYVCDRKAIIEFLRKQLSIKKDGKYHPEEAIHGIIFPRGKTSDDIYFDEHNLWLVDERLAFHIFLSSDKPIRQAGPLQSESRKEPDILVFDKAVAFSETPDVPFSSITIIEFKKPQRNEYGEKENPFTQIADYVRDIREGKAKLADGRSLPIPQNLPFYCYLVCDITPRLVRWAGNFELQKTPDELGFFGYKRDFNAYCEVISYSKLVSDAEKRNKAFFEKLGLPKQVTNIHKGS